MIEIGEYSYGANGVDLQFEFRGRMGEGTYRVGKFCAFGSGIQVLLKAGHILHGVSTFPFYSRLGIGPKDNTADATGGDVIVGNDVWVGNRVMLVGPVEIGDGAIIGAGSVVRGYVPPYGISVGNPAAVLRRRFDQSIIDKMLAIQWWDWDIETIKSRYEDLNFMPPQQFVDKYYKEEA